MDINTHLFAEWDYVEAIIDLPHDEFQRWLDHHNKYLATLAYDGVVVQQLRVKALPLPCPPGAGVWRVTAWGGMSAYLFGVMTAWRWQSISRLDLRVQFPKMSDAQVEHIVAAGLARDRKNTVQTFNARPRQHKAGGWTGGYGLAVGSGESDTRFTFYQKPGEPAQMEVQLSGRPLNNLLKAAWEASGGHHIGTPQDARCDRFAAHVQMRVYDVLTRKLRSVPSIAERLEDATGYRLRDSWLPLGTYLVHQRSADARKSLEASAAEEVDADW